MRFPRSTSSGNLGRQNAKTGDVPSGKTRRSVAGSYLGWRSGTSWLLGLESESARFVWWTGCSFMTRDRK